MTYRHGYSTRTQIHPLYSKWRGMIQRCENKLSPAFKHYGERGISVCADWRKDFKNFLAWALDNYWEDGLEIDRADNDKDYSPENCRFVNRAANVSNRRKQKRNTSGYIGVYHRKDYGNYNAFITVKGERFSLGCFSNPIDAAVVRDSYIISNNLIYYTLNFPQPITSLSTRESA